MARERTNDIKAPDGFTLGGIRRVRQDGTVLFGRGWWKAPAEWIGERVWVHVIDPMGAEIEAAPPGEHIYAARLRLGAVTLERTDRPGAAPVYRDPDHKAWAARGAA